MGPLTLSWSKLTMMEGEGAPQISFPLFHRRGREYLKRQPHPLSPHSLASLSLEELTKVALKGPKHLTNPAAGRGGNQAFFPSGIFISLSP